MSVVNTIFLQSDMTQNQIRTWWHSACTEVKLT